MLLCSTLARYFKVVVIDRIYCYYIYMKQTIIIVLLSIIILLLIFLILVSGELTIWHIF